MGGGSFRGGQGVGLGGQGRFERSSEVFVKIKKKLLWGVESGGRVWGVRVDVYEKFKFLRKLKKKNGGGWGSGLRLVSGRVGGGIRVDVNTMLGVGGDVGYRGCEPRI